MTTEADSWRRALDLLAPNEAAELERLMAKRKPRRVRKRVAQVAPPPTPVAPPPAAPAPRQPDNRIWFIPDDPKDPLGSFRDRSNGAVELKYWIDGV